MTITFSAHEFTAAMKGAIVVAYPPGEGFAADQASPIDDFAHFARVPQRIVSPAEAAKSYWCWDVMPKTMHRLA
jgi:hypothetical protein